MVRATSKITTTTATRRRDRPMFVKALMDQADEILNNNVEVTFEEVPEK